MSNNPKHIYSALRQRGFTRTSSSCGINDPHIYERREEFDGKRLVYIAKIWPNGKHSMSHCWSGYKVVPPSYFVDECEISAVIKEQSGLVHVTQSHVKKFTNLEN